MTGIFHIHTSYSFDAMISPRRVVNWLQNLGVDFAAITDHETIQGALEVRNICRSRPICMPKNEERTHEFASTPLQIIIGAEYYTDKGDIIGLFLEKEIKSRKSDEIIEEIKEQGGIVVLPHPYKSHKLDKELIKAVDVIEVFNARTSQNKNAKALALAKEYGKPGIAASDAHFLQEIGLTRMSFDTSKCHSERQRKISRGACPDNYEILHFVQNDRGESQSETSQSETSQSETSQGETSLKSAILNSEGRIIRAEESPLFYSTFTGLVKFYKTKDPHIPLAWIKKLRSLLVDREL